MNRRISPSTVLLLVLLSSAGLSRAALGLVQGGVHLLPINCQELLPDEEPFIEFFAAVAKASADNEKDLSRRMFRILALRDKLERTGRWDQNPVDTLVRKTLCFYREQKEPLKPVTFDNPQLISFLKDGVKKLEAKVEDAIFITEFEQEQRRVYEAQIERNRNLIRELERTAEREAGKSYDRIADTAKRKARKQ